LKVAITEMYPQIAW